MSRNQSEGAAAHQEESDYFPEPKAMTAEKEAEIRRAGDLQDYLAKQLTSPEILKMLSSRTIGREDIIKSVDTLIRANEEFSEVKKCPKLAMSELTLCVFNAFNDLVDTQNFKQLALALIYQRMISKTNRHEGENGISVLEMFTTNSGFELNPDINCQAFSGGMKEYQKESQTASRAHSPSDPTAIPLANQQQGKSSKNIDFFM